MVPAGQRLDRDDVQVVEGDHRLVVDLELVVVEAATDLGFVLGLRKARTARPDRGTA